MIKLDDAHEHLQRWGISQDGLVALLQELEEIPTDRVDAERKARFATFLKGFKKEASLDDTKAALVCFRFSRFSTIFLQSFTFKPDTT